MKTRFNSQLIHSLIALLMFITLFLASAPTLQAQSTSANQPNNLTVAAPEISGGALSSRRVDATQTQVGPAANLQNVQPPEPGAAVGTNFTGFGFDDNITLNSGFFSIPADANGAAGSDRLVAVVNRMIEARSKSGSLLWRSSLKGFFSALGSSTLVTFAFDPKVNFDSYQNRFVVVALERTDISAGEPSNESRILLAVSKNASPATNSAADWVYTAVNSKITINGLPHWADYPGFAIDEEAIYITANMYGFGAGGAFGGVRLWIFHKGTLGGLYAGGASTVTFHNPYAVEGFEGTTTPAKVYGAGGAGATIGTYLVLYDGLSDDVTLDEFLQIMRIDTPLTTPTFTLLPFLNAGNIENAQLFPLPAAPQSGSTTGIDVFDRRVYDAVWRNGNLWVATIVIPVTGADSNQTTVHWFRVNTTGASPVLADQGNIGGNDIAANAHTYYPSLAVNSVGDACFGFTVSASTRFAGAYATCRKAADAPGTVQASAVVKAGVAYYVRAIGGTRNRWGDYSGMSLDPADDSAFWAFNQWADTRGTLANGEDGRWGTAWGQVNPNIIIPVDTPTSTATNTSVPPTATRTPTPTNTAIPSTATSTNTSVPPTATRTPTPTNTTIPSTATSTNTSVPPTATRTPTPTNTTVPPTATATNTNLPATATRTPTPTNTTVPPTATATNTSVPATATRTPLPTNTPVPPTATPTNTGVPPTITSTPLPTNTTIPSTATPTNTGVPPTITSTPLPTDTTIPPTATPTNTIAAATPTDTPLPATPTNTTLPSTVTPTATSTPNTGVTSITIINDAQPDDAVDFTYWGPFGMFLLDNPNVDDGDSTPNAKTYLVSLGDYGFGQVVQTAWYLAAISCTGGEYSADLLTRNLIAKPKTGEQMVCTFMNQMRGRITAIKYNDLNGNGKKDESEPILPNWGIQLFASQFRAPLYLLTNASGQAVYTRLRPNSYKVCEVQQTGWSNSQPATIDPTSGQPCYTFSVTPGDDVTLYFGNTTGAITSRSSDMESGVVVTRLTADTLDPEDALDTSLYEADLGSTIFLPFVSR